MMHGSLPAKLQVLRARQGLTLIEAAEKIGIGRDTLSDLERGNRHPVMPTLAKIALGYGVPVEELLEEPVPLAEWGREAHGLAPYATPEERRTVLNEVARDVQYAISRAEYWEQELERGRTTRYSKADGAQNLAILARDEFSEINRWLGDIVAPGLDAQIERGLASEIADEYVDLMDTLVDRVIQTQHALFDHAAHVAETQTQQDALAKLREKADRGVKIRSHSTKSA